MSVNAAFGYAPGKIILLGEHAVVYGQPALAATLDRGIRVAVAEGESDRGPEIRGSGLGLKTRARPDPDGEGPEALRKALAQLVELFGDRVKKLHLTAEGAIPAGSGLGSSAALSVALVRGVHRFFEEQVSDEQVIEEALLLERVFHGNPSGVDHSAIASGGLVWFKKGLDGAPNALQTVEPRRRLRFAIGLAGPHAGTAAAVGALRDRMKRHPGAYEHLFSGIGRLVDEGRKAAAEGHLGSLGELMDLNQGYLNALGVSTPAIETLCATARKHGALGAKLSGAGGGGAVIALVDEDPEPVLQSFVAAGFDAFPAEIDAVDSNLGPAKEPVPIREKQAAAPHEVSP
jgi:mevalonate kinase